MVNFDDARIRVLSHLNQVYGEGPDALVILDDRTIEKPYGWIFFYNSREFVETGDFLHALGGNGPVVFEAATGEIHQLQTAREPIVEIRRFEEGRGLEG